MYKKYADIRKAAGLCVRCGGVQDRPGRCTCSKCYAFSKRQSHARQYMRREAGLCTSCGKRKPEPSGKTCAVCRAEVRAALQKGKIAQAGISAG